MRRSPAAEQGAGRGAGRTGLDESAKALAAMVASATIFGLAGLLFHALSHVPAVELLCHRLLWSFVSLGIYLSVARGGWGPVRAALRDRRDVALLASTAVLMASVWGVFIYAVTSGQAVEASLGFYIMPLLTVLLAFFVLGERFSPVQYTAIALAALAVALLAVEAGQPPWIALYLGGGLAVYGLFIKRSHARPAAGFFIELSVLIGPALAALFGMQFLGWSDFDGSDAGYFGSDARTTALMILSGPLVTVLPMILFTHANQHLKLATAGLLFYINPTLQFLVAVLAFGEVLTLWETICFPIIWAALAIYSLEALRRQRRARSRAEGEAAIPHPAAHGRA